MHRSNDASMDGDVPVKTAVGSGAIELVGSRDLRECFERWLARSGFAEIRDEGCRRPYLIRAARQFWASNLSSLSRSNEYRFWTARRRGA
jgi:hypothetical protein